MLFAVYGTLKKAYGNHGYLGKAKFRGIFRSPANYTLLDGGFPVVERGGNTSIECELYETDNEREIENVFSLEGCKREQDHPRSWYTFDLLDTNAGQATMFVMNADTSGRKQVIESGVWGKTRAAIAEIV